MMVHKISGLILFSVIAICILFSCSGFEEGPFFSLMSVKGRICRDWKVEYSLNKNSGITHSADFDGWLFTLSKDGSFMRKVIYSQAESQYNGKWELIGKSELRLEYTSSSATVVEFYTILRLTKEEFWLKDEVQEIHYYSE